jgi:hypothetical protein
VDLFPALQGQAFCFLPLPVRTRLPVHVNAYFELSSNRRDIWRADDTVGDSRVRGLWNEALLKGVLAPLYAVLLAKIKAVYFSAEAGAGATPAASAASAPGVGGGGRDPLRLLSLLPCPVPRDSCWQLTCDALFPLLKSQEVAKTKYMSCFTLYLLIHAMRVYT